jgi:hypothetical protein
VAASKHDIDREVTRLFDKARRSAEDSAPRKHHVVPRSYLERWAEDGVIRVTDVDRRQSFVTAPAKAARQTDFYSLSDDGLDPKTMPPLLMETLLSEVEGMAVRVVDHLVSNGVETLTDEQRLHMSTFLAFQQARGRAVRERIQQMVNSHLKLSFQDCTDEDIRAHLQRIGVASTKYEIERNRNFLDDLQADRTGVASPPAQAIALAMSSAEQAAQLFYDRDWLVFSAPPILVTCDEPVIVIGGPGLPRGERAGLLDAAVVAFALSPSCLLTMLRPGMTLRGLANLTHIEVAEVNREILASTFRYAFERPGRRISERLQVPPTPDKAFITEQVNALVDGEPAEVYRHYSINRWHGFFPEPTWPVDRWWST